MPKKILYVWKSEYPWDVRVEKMCKSFVENDYETHLLCLWNGEECESEIIDGVHIQRAGYKKSSKKYLPVSFNPFWKNEIEKSIKHIKPDLIMPREIMLATACGKLGRKYNIPVVMDMAENYPQVMKGWEKYRQGFWKNLSVNKLEIPSKIEKNSLSYMNSVITVCKEQNDRLAREYNYYDTYVLHNSPSISQFPISDISQNESNKFDRENLVFAYHGAVNTERNLELLIDAFGLLRNNNYKLIIAGDGPELENIRLYANEKRYRRDIEISGKYKHSDIIGLYEKCDIGILPYKIDGHINNTISNKFFDYMATGKPMIVSDAKPMRRLIKEHNLGIVGDVSSAEMFAKSMLSIIEKDLLEFSKNGREAYKEKYNWESEFKEFLKYLDNII